MARNANATVPRCWYTLVRNRPTPGTPIAKSASLCSANSLTCRGVMICSASDFSSSGFMGFESSGTSSPFKRIVAGRPTLRSRSDALRCTISVMACLKLNVVGALGMGIHPAKGLPELDRLGVLQQHLPNHAGDLGFDLVHDLHRFDDAHHLSRGDAGPHLHVGLRTRLGSGIERPHHGGLDLHEVGRRGRGDRTRCRGGRRRLRHHHLLPPPPPPPPPPPHPPPRPSPSPPGGPPAPAAAGPPAAAAPLPPPPASHPPARGGGGRQGVTNDR